MPRNGSGVYTLPALNPVVTNTIITSTWGNNTLTDIAAALTKSVATDGVSAISANLPMTGFRHTSVGAAASFDNYARADQVQESTFQILTGVASSGAVNTAYTANLLLGQPASRAFALNQFIILVPNTDAIGSPTLNVNGSGPVTIAALGGGSVAGFFRLNSPVTLTWNGVTWVVVGSGAAVIPYNYIINGGCAARQRPQATLSTSLQYGIVDRFKVGVLLGTVSAGTIIVSASAPIGRTGFAVFLSGVTMAGTPSIMMDTYIERLDAVNLKNAVASFSGLVYQTAVASATYTISIDKANTVDNFAAVTNIATSAGLPVLQNTSTQIRLENVAMGDCSNGVRIRLTISGLGVTVTTKDFYYTELQLTEGPSSTPFTRTPLSAEYPKCLRYFQKSFQYEVQPVQNAGLSGSLIYSVTRAGANAFELATSQNVTMRTQPVITFYNPAAANSNWRNITGGADSGASSQITPGGCGPVAFVNAQVAGDALGNRIAVHYTLDADF